MKNSIAFIKAWKHKNAMASWSNNISDSLSRNCSDIFDSSCNIEPLDVKPTLETYLGRIVEGDYKIDEGLTMPMGRLCHEQSDSVALG